MAQRFQFLTNQEIDSCIRRSTPSNTRKCNTFATHMYDEWIAARNKAFPNDQYPDLPDLPDLPLERIGEILSHFLFEIRRKDGKEYPADTIYGIMCGIMRYFRDDCLRPDLNFFDKSKDEFHYLRNSLDCRMKELTAKGVGLQKKQATPIERSDEERLWSSQAFSIHSSEGLLTATYFYVCKIFGLRSRNEHRQLTIGQFQFCEDDSGKFVEYTGKSSQIKHYDTESSLSSYKIIKLYIDTLRECDVVDGPFYRRPLMTVARKKRFSTVPLGVNNIASLLPNAAKKAGLQGNFTACSGKVSCATSLYRANVDEQVIMSRTGHRSTAVRAYKRSSAEQEKKVSQILDYEDSPTAVKRIQDFSVICDLTCESDNASSQHVKNEVKSE